MLEFTKLFGIELQCRSENSEGVKCHIKLGNIFASYATLAVLPPTAARNRLALLVRDPNFPENNFGSVLYVR